MPFVDVPFLFERILAPEQSAHSICTFSFRKHFIFLSPFRSFLLLYCRLFCVLYFTSFSPAAIDAARTSSRTPSATNCASRVHFRAFFLRFSLVSANEYSMRCATQKTFKCINIHFLWRCNGFVLLYRYVHPLSSGGASCRVPNGSLSLCLRF